MTARRLWALAITLCLVPPVAAAPVGTGFAYQGQLRESGAPANGAFDFEFALFNVATGGGQITTVLRDDAPVANGGFTVELDFTEVPFALAQDYFLEVRVRAGASVGGYTQLLPRQKITPAPYALNARTVQAGGVSQGSIAPNAVGSAQLQPSAVDTTQISNLAVTDAKIANATITAAKLAFTAGDITGVAAGSGLLGGGASGDLAIAVDPSTVQSRITGACAIGAFIRSIAADGSVICEGSQSAPRLSTVDDPSNFVGSFSSIAIGVDGLPVISYHDSTSNALKVAKCTTATCSGVATAITTVEDIANDVGAFTSIAIGADGRPVISYMDFTFFELKVAKCLNAACTGAATITMVDGAPSDIGCYTSIAIGADNLPVISYQSNGGALMVAKCGNAACTGVATKTMIDNSGNEVGRFSDLAIGADGLPVISYSNTGNGTLKVAKCATGACSGAVTITTVDDPAINMVGTFSSIAIGADGLPVISYRDDTAGDLKVAKCTTGACSGAVVITVVDDSVNAGYTSIDVGPDGLPVIGYSDGFTDSLKVVKCVTAACSGPAIVSTLDDSAGEFGESTDTSIAIGADGLPVISYTDVSSRSLRVAKCQTESCQ